MKPIIKTEKENKVALAFIERLMDNEPKKNSKEGKLLNLLVEVVQIFEKRYDIKPLEAQRAYLRSKGIEIK